MKPSLFRTVLYATGAAFAWWSSQSTTGLPAAVWLAVTFIFLGAGLFSGLNWLAWTVVQRVREYMGAKATADLQLIEARRLYVREIAMLNPDQLKAVGMFRLSVEVIPDDQGPVYMYRIGETGFTFDELSTWWEACGKAYLAPVGRWGEGSRMRRVAETITAWLVADGCADKAAGPNPAKWVDRELAAIKLGIGEGD